MLSINTNVSSLNSQRNLNGSQSSLSTSLQRLSSGLRINSAKDDAAGLAISQRFTSQINGLNQAVKNANDGISLAQTAEGALGQVGDALQRVRELAVQSANATNSASDRAALQKEAGQLISEIGRIGSTTNFNGLKVLDGTYSNQQYQVGANSGQTINVSVGDSRAAALGADTQASKFGVVSGGSITNADFAGGIKINGTAVAGGASESALVDNINAQTSATGVSATLASSNVNEVAYTADATNANTLKINGVSIGLAAGTTGANAATAINDASSQTGVTASFAGGKLTLTSAGGADVTLADDATNGVLGAINGGTSVAKKDAVLSAGIELSSKIGGTITVAAGASGSTSADLNLTGTNTAVSKTFKASTIDISSVSGANDAIKAADFALGQINSTRAQLGAVQNRFTAVVSNLQSSSENLSASRSRILDTDFASETANLSRNQILQQAGTAMLAQSNALANNVLSLLKG